MLLVNGKAGIRIRVEWPDGYIKNGFRFLALFRYSLKLTCLTLLTVTIRCWSMMLSKLCCVCCPTRPFHVSPSPRCFVAFLALNPVRVEVWGGKKGVISFWIQKHTISYRQQSFFCLFHQAVSSCWRFVWLRFQHEATTNIVHTMISFFGRIRIAAFVAAQRCHWWLNRFGPIVGGKAERCRRTNAIAVTFSLLPLTLIRTCRVYRKLH